MSFEQRWDYAEALRAIWERSAYDRGFVSNPFWGDAAATLGLRRTERLLERLGRPQDGCGIIHVAGSKGKGSACAFAAAILRSAGYRAGLYTSPHLHSFRERIAVDGESIAEDAFADLTRTALFEATSLEQDEPELGEITAFELTTAMALRHFANEGCDLSVVEVGMGGTLDSTNVVTPLVSAITTLDYEHTRVLGDRIEEIAANKAGIIKPGRPVVVSAQPAEVLEVIERAATDAGSDLLLSGQSWEMTGSWTDCIAEGPWGRYEGLRSGLVGSHQVENAGVAIAATWLLNGHGYSVPESAARGGLATVRWPGRFEVVDAPDRPRIILDGAHTPASAAALANAFREIEPERAAAVVLAVMADKDPLAMARALAPVATAFVVTSTRNPRAMGTKMLAEGLSTVEKPVVTAAGVPAALAAAERHAGPEGLVIVTGSLATVAEAREALGLGTPDPDVTG
ncbi:MAG: bifunctional folylpolyglutamate synthase/dihydrofolate synthase [Thermomicrobiales bacterium]